MIEQQKVESSPYTRFLYFTTEELHEFLSGLSWKEGEGQGGDLTQPLAQQICLVLKERKSIEDWECKRWGLVV